MNMPMTKRLRWLILFFTITSAGAWLARPLPATAAPPRVEPAELYRAERLAPYTVTNELGQVRRGRDWQFSAEDHCNFVFFSPSVQDKVFSSEGLTFTTSGEEALIGWGNVDDLQPRAERIPMFPGFNDIELTVRQTATASVWRITLWMDGSSVFERNTSRHEFGGRPWATVRRGTFEAQLAGTEPQTLRFRAFRGQPDGFSLRIRGPADNRIVIDGLRITQTESAGSYRRRFTLPPGRKVWRAVGEAGGVRLYMDGREIDFMPELLKPKDDMTTYPVDLAPYLEPGAEHVLALDPDGSSLAYFQGRIVLDDGREIVLDTGPDWLGTFMPAEGWTARDFDDSGWETAPHLQPDRHHLNRRWPVYDGPILLENPGPDPAHFYDDAGDTVVMARIPGNWAGPRPGLRWVLRGVERGNVRPELARGELAPGAARPRGGSLRYPINVGRLEQGVYTLAVDLVAGGETVASRFEEPIVVTGRLAMREVSGDTYEEGLDLELENVIDFTDPDDPHRWIEVTSPGAAKARTDGQPVDEPLIRRSGDLVYREVTDHGVAAMFSYRFEFRRPYGWYLMVLEYPNDAERSIGVAVTSAERNTMLGDVTAWAGRGATECGPSIHTGGKYPTDNRLHELRWLHWADAEIHSFDIVNLSSLAGRNAAAARLRIYRVDELPALRIDHHGERLFGIHTERARQVGRTFGDTSGMDQYQNAYVRLGYDMVARFTQRLRWQHEAARNYTQYLRFTGQNAHVMGAFQYNEMNTPYTPPERVPGDSRILQDIREQALRYFGHNNIVMYSLVEYLEHRAMRRHFMASNEDIAAGADTINFVSRGGEQGGWTANPNHPAVEMGYLHVAEDLAEKFAFSPAWQGIFYNVTGTGEFGPAPFAPARDPFEYDYSDATIARFEEDTGIRVPGDGADPRRFDLRYRFLTSEAMLDLWIDWRCRNMGSYLIKTRDVLRRHRPDLRVLCGWHLTVRPLRLWPSVLDLSFGEYARRLAMDPAVVRDESDIWFGRTLYPYGGYFGTTAIAWPHHVAPDAIAHYDGPNRMVVLNTCWHEITTRPGDVEGWPRGAHAARFISQASGDYALESFTQAMIGADPDKLIFGYTDVNIINSREQQVRQVARALTPLPRARFEPVAGTTDFTHDLALRALRQDGYYWFYVANPGYWPVKGAVILDGPATVARAQDGSAVATQTDQGRTVVPVELGPYGLAAFRAQAPRRFLRRRQVRITDWRTEALPEEHLEHMRGIITEVRALLADDRVALAVARRERDFLRETCRAAEEALAAGRYAAAWAALTHWRFWRLWKEDLLPARELSARLPDRPDQQDWNPHEEPTLPVARAHAQAPVINGCLDEDAWREAQTSFRFLAMTSGANLRLGLPQMDMAVQAAYDGQALYIALRMADPDPGALKSTADPENPVEVLRNYDDTVVLFLSPDGQRARQFAVNAGGVKYYAATGAWEVRDQDLRAVNWQAAMGVREDEWIVEMAIPFSELDIPPPEPGTVWRANFLRRFRDFIAVPETYWARISRWENAWEYGTLVFQ